MHCYRCGRRVADRSPRCENCGQKFNYGGGEPSPRKSEPDPATAAPAIIPPPPRPSALGDSIFELSRTSQREPEEEETTADEEDDDGHDPTVPARAALTEATDQAVVELGRGSRAPIETSSDEPAVATALSSRPPDRERDRDSGSSFAVGKVLSGRLEIVADLGGGPIGRVFKAIDRKKGTVVAVKAIAASRLPPEALSGRFAEMIQLVKGLTHPNLVRVHGAGRDGDTAFVIMQHLEGLPLRRLLDVKRENNATFTFEEAEPIVVQICQGLQFAHTVLVHGGLKPENVFVQVDSLKLIDVGFSRLFPPGEWREVQRRGKGAGAYLAPEFAADQRSDGERDGRPKADQRGAERAGGERSDGERDGRPKADRARIDRRADVYSVGAILYEMLTGRAPAGPDAPAVSSLNPSVPRAVDRVVQKAMAVSPENRYATAAELKDAVMRVLGGDILAEDLEAPGDQGAGTFVADEDEKDLGLEIEYVEAPPDPDPEAAPRGTPARASRADSEGQPDRRSDDATPVGAIELQEPLWEPDEIAETRVSDPHRKTEELHKPDFAGAAAIARPLSRPRLEDATAPSAMAQPMPEPESLGPAGSKPSADRPSTERTSISALGEDDHQSIDLAPDEPDASGTQSGLGPAPSGVEPRTTRATPSWLDRVEGPKPGAAEPVLSPRSAPGPRAGREVELSEGSPLDLELDDADGPPSARPPVPPTGAVRTADPAAPGDAPTIRRDVRHPQGTPAPWDPSSRERAGSTAQLADADRPTDPRQQNPADRPTAPRPRFDDNPAARALSPPIPPPLELTFSVAAEEEGVEGAPALDGRIADPARIDARRGDRPTADAPAPMVKPPLAGTASMPPVRAERPTLTGGGIAQRGFVTRRQPSRLPWIFAFVGLLAAVVAGGAWGYRNSDRFAALLPTRTPAAPLVCPDGMIGFADGAFLQGSLKLDPDRDITEVESREVEVKQFCIDRFEFPNEAGAAPLTGVTFEDAAQACATAGKRLCTETEWERACKGDAGSRYPYGDRFEAGICNVGTHDEPGKPGAAGAFAECGAGDGPRDLSGNVWEMTATGWPDDPAARVIKGGSAKLPAWGARCAYRDLVQPGQGADDVGFRCCKS